jgi:WD40 repeat protein
MPDVFISYSRRNAELVRRLHAELGKRGMEAWVDWEDIPPASKFERDLEEGVAKSDAFVFVISPDSLDSSYCLKELHYAGERNKRIVPIMHRPVDVERLPESLRTHNWIPSSGRFEDDFDGGMTALVAAIETDLEWVRAHTRWGTRAEEWRRSDRDRSFLLRGTELAAAERWIAGQEGKDPPPTRLHSEYVLASRRAATRRQRVTLAATGAALVVAVGLAVVALVQRNEAISQRDQALSRALAASASENLTVDPELGVLLALEAVDARVTPEAEASLRHALGAWRHRASISDHDAPVWRGAFSPDGEWIATGERDSVIHVWMADTGEHVQTFRGRGRIAALGFSRSGDRVVAVPDFCGDCNSYSGDWNVSRARAWDVATGELAVTGRRAVRSLHAAPESATFDRLQAPPRPANLHRLPVRDESGRLVATLHGRFQEDYLRPIARSPDGSLIALGGERPGIWDARSGRLLADLRRHLPTSGGSPPSFVDVAFSPDGTLLAAMGIFNTLVLRSADGHRIARLPDSGAGFGRVAFSADGAQLVTAPDRGEAELWEPKTGRMLASLPTDGVRSAVFSPDGTRVLTASTNGTASSWEAAPAGVALEARRPSVAAVFGPDGTRVATADRTGATYLHDAASGELIATLGRPTRYPAARFVRPGTRYPRLRFNADGSLLFGSGAGGEARVWEASSGELVATLGDGATSDAIPVPGDELALLVKERGFRVELWDIRAEAFERRITTGTTLGPAAAVSSDRRVATFGDAGMIWSLEGEELLEKPMKSPGFVVSAEFSPDDGHLVTVDDRGPVRLWDARSGRHVWEVGSEAHGKYTAGFSDDDQFVTNGQEVWEVQTAKRQASLAHGMSLSSSSFSHDGKFVLTTGGGKTLLWDVGTGEQLYAWNEGRVVVADELFSPDGTRVLTADRRAAHVYACGVCGSLDDLVALAEQRVTRELTEQERETYGLD